MAEEKERSTPKSRIETLSDLIFGLALSIGALTLIGNAPSNFSDLLKSIGYFAFSFFILISVWYTYTSTMSNVRIEKRIQVQLNLVLLFLVSIEPFLFNELFSKIPTMDVSTLYAVDLGGLFVILSLLANSILSDKKRPEELLHHYAAMRNSQIVGAAFFFISVIPFFWSWAVPINSETSIPLRFILWMVPLFLHFIRRIWERQSNIT
ncbi:MAG: TMEM175 family protein [Candidatus Bathyarchaeia archaeon]